MRIAHVFAASAVLVCTTAFAQSNAGIPAPKSMQELAQELHSGNQMEIQMGKLAQQRGTSPEVKQYGQMLAQDHQRLDQQLTQFAQKKGWKLSSQAKPSDPVGKAFQKRAEDTKELLNQLHGTAFDTQFMTAMVSDHDKDLLVLGQAIQKFPNDPMTQVLSQQVVPTLDKHRQRAYQILGDLQPQVKQMGVGGAGQQGGMMQQGQSGQGQQSGQSGKNQ